MAKKMFFLSIELTRVQISVGERSTDHKCFVPKVTLDCSFEITKSKMDRTGSK